MVPTEIFVVTFVVDKTPPGSFPGGTWSARGGVLRWEISGGTNQQKQQQRQPKQQQQDNVIQGEEGGG